MPKPRLVIHIGMHKTATTAVQRAFESSRDRHLPLGVLYANTARPPWPELPKHCSVFSAAASGNRQHAAGERDRLLSEFEACGASTLVISEEGLSEPNASLAAFFQPFAGDFDIDVVCCLRRPDLFVEALYNQFVREDVRREARPLLAFSRAPATRSRLDYAAMLAVWQSLPARIVALDFERAVRAPSGFVAAFGSAAGLPEFDCADERHNGSPDMRLATLLARLNRQRVDCDVASLLWAARELQAKARFPPRRHLLGRDERRRLLDDLRPSLDRLAEAFGVRFSAELPSDEAACSIEDLDAAYLLELLGACSRRMPLSPP